MDPDDDDEVCTTYYVRHIHIYVLFDLAVEHATFECQPENIRNCSR